MTGPLPMTGGRRVALIIGVPVALAIIGWTGLSMVAFAGIGHYPVRLAVPVHGGTLRLDAGSADVRFTQAPGDAIRLTGKASYSLVRSTLTWHSSPAGVSLYPACHFVTGVCGFSLNAVVPGGMPTFISDGDGNLTLQGLTGSLTIFDGSGDILGSALSGTATLNAGSGNIRIGGLTSTQVKASDGSGDVTLTFTKVPDHVSVNAGSGNVAIVLPPGRTQYKVSATASSGSRLVRVPTNSFSGHVIQVSDGSGDVSITN